MDAFMCPLCGASFSYEAHSLRCARGHCFDMARSGSVNFVPQAKASGHYDDVTFSERARVLESGVYAVITQALVALLDELKPEYVLDAGCGEGYFTRTLASHHAARYYAFDLSKDSIRLAAKHRHASVHYFVADLTHVPLREHSMDCILNIFAPAHYAEFTRLLKPGGMLIKVIPGAEHLCEIRQVIEAPAYSNDSVFSHLKKHFSEVEHTSVRAILHLAPELRQALLRMTPLLQDIDVAAYDWSTLSQVTIAADILTARA